MMRFTLSALAMAAAVTVGAIPTTSPSTSSHNDFSCKSSHNPVVLLHGLAELLGAERGVKDVLGTFGCKACADLVTGGAAVQRLNDGSPIVQPGTVVTIITSKLDELVTPTETSFVHEPGVNNIYVQDYCPFDPVGHIGEAYDMDVWNLVLNSLEKKLGRDISCVVASPGR